MLITRDKLPIVNKLHLFSETVQCSITPAKTKQNKKELQPLSELGDGYPSVAAQVKSRCKSNLHPVFMQYHGPYPKTICVRTLFVLPFYPRITNVTVTKCNVSMKPSIALRLRSHFILRCLQSGHTTSNGCFLSTTLATMGPETLCRDPNKRIWPWLGLAWLGLAW